VTDVNRDEAVAAIVAQLPVMVSEADDLAGRVLDRVALASLPQPTWLAGSWLTSGSFALLYGKPGDGKTFVALDLACAIATGSWWHHCRTSPGAVLYVAAEGASMFDARITAWETTNDTAVERLYVLPDAVNLLDVVWADALATVAARLDVVLVVIDTLNRCMIGGDENTARDMGMFVAGCDTIRRTSGATVLVNHHDSRAGGNPRGSSALDGACDTILAVSADNGVVTVRTTKQKDAEPAAPLVLRLTSEGESAVLVDYIDHGELEGPRLELLRVLCEIADEKGVASGIWQRASGLAPRSFHRHRKWLLEHVLCHDISGTSTPRYAPTEAGRAAGASEVPTSAMASGQAVPATHTLLVCGTGTDAPSDTPNGAS
jgi:hypothetical protein